MTWFPEAATIIGGLEHRPTPGINGPKNTVQELLLKLPADVKKDIYAAINALGNIELRRLTFAYVDDKNGAGRNFVRLTGRFNHAWLGEFFKSKGLEVNSKDRSGALVTTMVSQGRGPAMALVGDTDLLIAGYGGQGKDDEVLEQALTQREQKQANAGTGKLKAALAKIPAQAVGYLVGEFPEELRTGLKQGLGAFPKKVSARLERVGPGIDVIVEGEMDDTAQAKTFIQTAGKLRNDALDSLQKLPPAALPGIDVNELQNMLNSLQLEAKSSTINVRLLISNEIMNMLPAYFSIR